MAVKNAVYQVDNGQGGFDEFHFRTTAEQVICEDGKTVEASLDGKVNIKRYSFTPTLLNAWGNIGEGYDALKVWKDELQNVRVQGVITGGSNKLMFNLPLEYRPGGHLTVPVISVNSNSVWAPSTLFINALTGAVETQGVIGKSHSIDITFLAER